MMRRFALPKPLAVAIGTIAIAAAVPCIGADAAHGETAITCTNPYSGTSWRIKIDYDRGTVDSNPAQISNATISWHDTLNGWNYTLDRKSGGLTIVLASSTGGSFLYDHCNLEN